MKNICYVLSFLLCISCQSQANKTEKKPNILFIAIDDLRPELGCYGSDIAVTPNLDNIANEGILFNRAYCQQAICSPSRASLMTGARPETINVIENFTYFRDENPDIITLPQHFKANGYETVYTGKIYHGKYNDPDLSWSRKPVKIKANRLKTVGGFYLKENQNKSEEKRKLMLEKYGAEAMKRGLVKGKAYECADVPDNTYEDGYNTDVAIATMKDLATKDKPFFLGLGFKKPHLNWVAPKKYWDLYNPEDITLSSQTEAPKNGAAVGLHPSFELRVRENIPNYGPLDNELSIKLKHAYLACVSYVDAQIGKMISALEKEGLRDNTIIVVWSDHGWHLGDMGIWGKATNYEIATRVPLLVSTPHIPQKNKGKKTEALVELLDIYPTLCDLASIEKPKHLEGESFVPLLNDPNQKWKKAVLSQFPSPALREWAANPLSKGMRETYFGDLIEDVETKIKAQQKDTWDRQLFENDLMGYSMRTDRYRLVLWKDYKHKDKPPLFIELYDHKSDSLESLNIAQEKPETVKRLSKLFHQQFE